MFSWIFIAKSKDLYQLDKGVLPKRWMAVVAVKKNHLDE